MEMRQLGRTGVKVSPLCLGAMMFGAWGNPDHDDSITIIHRALDAGINFIDTADVYAHGESEEIVGKAIRTHPTRRDEIVLATKVHGTMGEDPNQFGNSRRWIVRAVEDSLRRLGTDHIDLYQIHRPELDTDIDDTLGALSDLVADYVEALFGQISQAAACNRLHSNEARLSRWLLMTHDRVGIDEFAVTHEVLGQMLGSTRPTVTLSAQTLQSAGLIRYRSGQVTIVDRAGLESVACECYGVIKAALDRVVQRAPDRYDVTPV